LVTSPTGAAVRDLIGILRQRQPGLDILVIPALVQGRDAAPSIVAGLAAASNRADIDLVIVGRGGGSPEELWPFNEESVARAIAACRHPVISAVGHEIDFTIADFVADARAATPTAAAEMAVPDGRLMVRDLAVQERRLLAAQRRRLALERSAVARLCASPALLKPERLLSIARQRLDESWQDLVRGGHTGLAGARAKFSSCLGRLDSLSPLATLSRGYSICRLPDGRVVRDAGAVEHGDTVAILLHRGQLQCLVQQKEGSDD